MLLSSRIKSIPPAEIPALSDNIGGIMKKVEPILGGGLSVVWSVVLFGGGGEEVIFCDFFVMTMIDGAASLRQSTD